MQDERIWVQNQTSAEAYLDRVHKLTDTIKNIHKIESLDEGSSYGSYRGNGSYRGRYDDGNAYGRHYVRGHYSYDGERSMLSDKLESMMGEVSGDDRAVLERALEVIRR